MIDEEEFEKNWELAKARDEHLEAEWDALPPKEKEHRRKIYDEGFYERISDNPLEIQDKD